jgi:hypothetical protein
MPTLLNKIAEGAIAGPKPSRAKANEALLKFLDALQCDFELSGAQRDQLTSLYSFFEGAMASTKTLSVPQWVRLAVSAKDVRYYLMYLYCDGRRIICTDGHRIHIAPNEAGLEVGFYDANMIKTEVDADFPNIDQAIPGRDGALLDILNPDFEEMFAYYPIGAELDGQTVKKSKYVKKGVAILADSNGSTHVFNRSYIEDATRGRSKCDRLILNPRGTCLIEYEDGLVAVVQSMSWGRR